MGVYIPKRFGNRTLDHSCTINSQEPHWVKEEAKEELESFRRKFPESEGWKEIEGYVFRNSDGLWEAVSVQAHYQDSRNP